MLTSSTSQFRFGKHPPKIDYRTLRFKDFLTSSVAPPPASLDLLTRAYQELGVSDPSVLFPMDGNDSLGDCTIAALAHAITLWNGFVGKKQIMSKAAVVKLYMHLTGGVDSGMNELDVLNYWRKHKVSSDEIVAFASVDPHNHTHVQQAMQLFGGVYLGFRVQQNCLEEFQAKQPWVPGPLTTDGHAVLAVGYDATGLTVLTWGSTQKATWDWWDECVDEAYAIVPPEAKTAGFAPGYNLQQLLAALNDVAN